MENSPRRRAYDLYPFVLCRVGGQPFDALQSLDSVESLALAAELDRSEVQLDKWKRSTETAFRRVVGESIDPAQRRALIAGARNLRRNGKLSALQRDALVRAGDDRLIHAFERWRSLQAKIDELSRRIETTYDNDVTNSRRALRSLARDDWFLAGLALARPTLYRSFSHSLDVSFGEIAYNRSQRRMERALLRYFTRAAAKTTPFSTFGATVAAQLEATAADGSISLPQGGDVPRSTVTLNKVLYGLLYRSGLRDTVDLYHCFSVSLNPSLQKSADSYEMLVARDGREQLVRLPSVPVIDHAVAALSANNGTVDYTKLVRQLASDLRVEADEIGRRVGRMIKVGLLQLNSSISDYEPDWAPLLRGRLGRSVHPRAVVLRRLLDLAERIRAGFEAADAERRWTLIQRARRQLRAVFPPPGGSETAAADDRDARSSRSLEQHMCQRANTDPVYEDTSLAGSASVNRERLGAALAVLPRWIDWMRLLSLDWSVHANMRAHFARVFGGRGRPGGDGVSFLTFYKSFYAEVYEAFERHEKGARDRPFEEVANPFGLAGFEAATRAADRLCEVFNRLWAAQPDVENLHLSEAHFAEAVGDARAALEELSSPGPVSIAVFAQIVVGATIRERDSLLVDQQYVHPGMGKYFSRFLRLFDSQIAADLQTHNSRHPRRLVAELCDDSEFSFNANLHPPLAAYEINYPANLSGLDPRTNLSMSALDVTPDPDNGHRLKLVHRLTGQEVLPVNVGFLSPLRRPAIFRVLELFSPVFRHRLRIPWHNPELEEPRRQHSARGSVVYRPRVVFEQRLVLARRAWKVPADHVSRMAVGVSPAQAFRRLDGWRRSLGMPRRVFFSVVQATRPASNGHERSRVGRRHLSPGTRRRPPSKKPQYLSFGSSLLSQLLFEVARDHVGDLVFEEMLPTPEMLASRDGRRYATELVLQFDERAGACG